MRGLQAMRDLGTPYAARPHRDPVRYGKARRALALAGTARAVASVATVAFVAGDPLERALRRLPRPLRAPLFTLAVLCVETVADLGTEYVEDHVLERVFATSDRSAAAWLNDRAKGTGVGLAVTAILVSLADALVNFAPRRWPWIAVAAAPPLLAFATVVAPTFILPMFNRYEPVGGDLEQRIRALATRYGVGDAAILRFDMSRQTKKANAFVTGVLGTERIVLGDTLVDAFPTDETLFVVAHELGHYVRRDPWLGIGLGTLALGVTLFAANGALRATTGKGVSSPAQGARLAFYALLAQLVLTPAGNAASRALEGRADRFALDATGERSAGIAAFRRLAQQNLAEVAPPRWAEILFASHPSLATRISALESAVDRGV